MSKYYTNCQVSGNNILLKEIDNGERKRYKVEYKPTLYAPSTKNSKYHTLTGESVEPLKFDSIKEAREFVKTNEGTGYPLYGNTQYQYAFIADEYPEHELAYNLKDILIVLMDIECENETIFTNDSEQNAKDRINVITIKDINKALVLIAETGDSTHPLTSGLDEAVTYTTELYPDSRMEYHIVLQPLLQNAVGAFLLTAGHAEIKKGKRKKLKEITIIIEDITPGEADVEVKVYDPANKKLIFMGRMRSDMYNKDLGID